MENKKSNGKGKRFSKVSKNQTGKTQEQSNQATSSRKSKVTEKEKGKGSASNQQTKSACSSKQQSEPAKPTLHSQNIQKPGEESISPLGATVSTTPLTPHALESNDAASALGITSDNASVSNAIPGTSSNSSTGYTTNYSFEDLIKRLGAKSDDGDDENIQWPEGSIQDISIDPKNPDKRISLQMVSDLRNLNVIRNNDKNPNGKFKSSSCVTLDTPYFRMGYFTIAPKEMLIPTNGANFMHYENVYYLCTASKVMFLNYLFNHATGEDKTIIEEFSEIGKYFYAPKHSRVGIQNVEDVEVVLGYFSKLDLPPFLRKRRSNKNFLHL